MDTLFMDDEYSGYSWTSESEHSHFCHVCGCNWIHADEMCGEGGWSRGEMTCPECEYE